ncbi:DUF4334 domain-containing protein [Streptomyces sp. S.PB5]|uniref:DUF4334 domain-containing protein n=1 Tax=Streptomyces sp. S.PB5 TaxID=3020844 RepID=UPI0025B03153|nr:DUF4334 domain-containing protein [Streptomyces sp. S.PB5]MDN3022808.1 DUF4334 domain-containing protein [Streptomyces sp. S.PB5]
MHLKEHFLQVVRTGEACGGTLLYEVFDALEPVERGFLTGTWRGGVFDTACESTMKLVSMSWYGKRFDDTEDAEPLLCQRSDGSIAPNWELGQARLREVAFRGKTSVAMVYDSVPIIDHFRKADEGTVLGLMDCKGRPADFFFHLTRVHRTESRS